MKRQFKCNHFPKTDSLEVDTRRTDKNIAIHSYGREGGNPSGERWAKSIILTPKDAAEVGGELLDLAAKQGVDIPWFYNGDDTEEDTTEVYCKPQTKVTAEQVDEIMNNAKVMISTEFGKCTVVTVKLPNGFTITESSGCVDPANYDVHLGAEICLKRIRNKVWELEGYALQKKVHEEGIL